MARVAERRTFTAYPVQIEDALLHALTELGGEPPAQTGERAWRARVALGHVAFETRVALARSEDASVVSLLVEIEPSLRRAVAAAIPFVSSLLVHRAPTAALEHVAAAEIADQDTAATLSQSFWMAFETRLADLARQAGGAYRGG